MEGKHINSFYYNLSFKQNNKKFSFKIELFL